MNSWFTYTGSYSKLKVHLRAAGIEGGWYKRANGERKFVTVDGVSMILARRTQMVRFYGPEEDSWEFHSTIWTSIWQHACRKRVIRKLELLGTKKLIE